MKFSSVALWAITGFILLSGCKPSQSSYTASVNSPRANNAKAKEADTLNATEHSALASQLAGEWKCGSQNCPYQTLTFSPDLSQLTIKSYIHFCLFNNTVNVTFSADNPDAIPSLDVSPVPSPAPSLSPSAANEPINSNNSEIIYFIAQGTSLGTLDDTFKNVAACQSSTFDSADGVWTQNFSFTHSSDWKSITIDEVVFVKSETAAVSNTSVSPAAASGSAQKR